MLHYLKVIRVGIIEKNPVGMSGDRSCLMKVKITVLKVSNFRDFDNLIVNIREISLDFLPRKLSCEDLLIKGIRF